MNTFEIIKGKSPLIVSMPHIGYLIPHEMTKRMTASGCMSLDTDWNLDLLYDFLGESEATIIRSVYSRYVIDLGRDPANKPLYPGMDHPTLVPTETFDRVPLYRQGHTPDDQEIFKRVETYWRPYHDALSNSIAESLSAYGTAVLFDCHSIASVVPRYSPTRIPDLNLGTAGGTSCSPDLSDALMGALSNDKGFTTSHDGLFKGGFITRHYGMPDKGVHAFQLELSRATYMREAPSPALDEKLTARIRPVLSRMCEEALGWARRRSQKLGSK